MDRERRIANDNLKREKGYHYDLHDDELPRRILKTDIRVHVRIVHHPEPVQNDEEEGKISEARRPRNKIIVVSTNRCADGCLASCVV